MKILGLFGDGFGSRGGISRFNRELLSGLADLPQVAEIVAYGRIGDGPCGSLPPKLRWKSPIGKSAIAVASTAAAVRLRPDLIICGLVNLAPLASFLARRARVPLWSIGHGIDVWTRPSPGRASALEDSRLVTVVSRYTRKRLLEWARIPEQRVRILANTVDMGEFAPGPRSAELLTRYSLGAGPVLFTLGRLVAGEAYKGQDRVIAVLPRLAARHPGIRYLIGGEGDDASRLKRLSRSAGVEERVVFTGGIAEGEIAEHFRLADVFVMPSTGEGFGIVFLEAAACGVPVAGGDRDGSRDALRDGLLGELVDPLDPVDLVAGIERALGRPRTVPAAIEAFSRAAYRRLLPGLLERACGA